MYFLHAFYFLIVILLYDLSENNERNICVYLYQYMLNENKEHIFLQPFIFFDLHSPFFIV